MPGPPRGSRTSGGFEGCRTVVLARPGPAATAGPVACSADCLGGSVRCCSRQADARMSFCMSGSDGRVYQLVQLTVAVRGVIGSEHLEDVGVKVLGRDRGDSAGAG